MFLATISVLLFSYCVVTGEFRSSEVGFTRTETVGPFAIGLSKAEVLKIFESESVFEVIASPIGRGCIGSRSPEGVPEIASSGGGCDRFELSNSDYWLIGRNYPLGWRPFWPDRFAIFFVDGKTEAIAYQSTVARDHIVFRSHVPEYLLKWGHGPGLDCAASFPDERKLPCDSVELETLLRR